jgi:amidase
MTIYQMKQALEKGSITSVELTKASLAKIEEYLELNSVIEVNPDALAIAQRCDERVGERGALHGIPILIKDNINTGDSMATSAGSVALAKNIAREDAGVVKLLRQAGAVIVGKANMTEFANYMCDFRLDEKMPNGYSSRGGQTVHPVHKDADPSGSSTGSAVAVAVGIVPAAVGSETYGSIISPAQKCGVVGIKPTDGLISKEGGIPISFTLDTLGPMAGAAEDVALMLSVMADRSYPMKCKPEDIRMGICRAGEDDENWPWARLWRVANEELVETMRRVGINVKELPEDDIGKVAVMGDDLFVFPIMEHEFRYGINKYLASACEHNPEIPKSLTEIIEYNKEHEEIALKYGQGNLINGDKVSDNWREEEGYIKALREREEAITSLGEYFDRYKIDILMMMSAHCGIAATTGFPSITFPIGKCESGLPAGCMLVARSFHEDRLLAVARLLERDME